MTILTTDLVFFAASFQTDEPSGGGLPSGVAIQDGIENNLFPDVAPGDRDLGRVQLRKFYPSVVSANTDALLTAQCLVSVPPEDPAVGVVLFRFGSEKTTRAEAAAALQQPAYNVFGGTGKRINQAGLGAGTELNVEGSPADFEAGQLLELYSNVSSGFISGPKGQFTIVSVGAEVYIGVTFFTTLTLDRSFDSGGFTQYAFFSSPREDYVRCVSGATSTALSETSAISIDRTQAQLVPFVEPYPLTVNGIDPSNLSRSSGRIPIFRPLDTVLIEDATNAEMAIIAAIDYRGRLEFSAPLTNSYTAGARVSGLLDVGDLQATAGPGFSQQTWTRTFSDSLIGTPASASYNRSIFPFELTNEGAVTERWAIVFTGPENFQLIGETRGLVAFGTVFEAFEPNNPQINQPYFVIQPEGWSEGWSTGNAYRFNTTGASAPVWAARTVSPSEPDGLVEAVIKLRGGVDA